MEWALSIPREQALEWIQEPWGGDIPSPMADVREVLAGAFWG